MFVLRNRIVAAALLALAAWVGDAGAVCPIQPFHVTLWVGDTASHPLCTYDTIQQAVDAVQCPNTVIVLTHEHTYTAQHITINGKPSMTLAGVDTSVACGVDPPEINHSVRTIDGTGNGTHSVFSITNSDVTFQYLEISGGSTATGARGGGISAAGNSHITLEASLIDGNSADFGGGVAAVDSAVLSIQDFAAVNNNSARSNGGGVFLADFARMDMRGERATILSNQATGHDGDFGYGGGVFAGHEATANIGSPGGIIGFNNARAGGGVAVFAADGNGYPAARLFAVDPTRPVLVYANRASVHGGGLYANAKGNHGLPSEASLCAQDFRIVENKSPDGAAIYAADDSFLGTNYNGKVYLNRRDATNQSACNSSMDGAGIGAPACEAGGVFTCNEITGNAAVDATETPTGGAIIKGAWLVLNEINMRDNAGGEMIYGYNDSHVELTNSLIADNDSDHELVHGEIDATIRNVTIANNTIDNGSVFFLKRHVDFEDNLVWQPGQSTIAYQTDGCSGCFGAKNALVSEAASFPEGLAVELMPSLDAFGFIDPGNAVVDKRNYRLGAWTQNGQNIFSPALDFAAHVSGDDRDLDNRPREQDIPVVDNGPGNRDLGCYELQNNQFISDRIFADAFGDRISLLH